MISDEQKQQAKEDAQLASAFYGEAISSNVPSSAAVSLTSEYIRALISARQMDRIMKEKPKEDWEK